jgi:hypothetical protein
MAGKLVVSTLNNDTGVLATQNGMTGIAKAWVNFNGTGTVAIRDSFNVSSITDNGTGDYTVNFTTAMPNANYAIAGAAKYTTANNNFALTIGDVNGTGAYSTTAVRVCPTTGTSSARYDCDIVTVIVFSS